MPSWWSNEGTVVVAYPHMGYGYGRRVLLCMAVVRVKEAAHTGIAKTLWHVERKINEMTERLVTIESTLHDILDSLYDNDEAQGPNPGDDDWLPDTQSLRGVVA